MAIRFRCGFLALCLTGPVITLTVVTGVLVSSVRADELRVPAFTAYMVPDPDAARFSEERGLSAWNDSAQSVNWYGLFRTSGDLTASVILTTTGQDTDQLKLSIAGLEREAAAQPATGEETVTRNFGTFRIPSPGYHVIRLTSASNPGQSVRGIETLILDGPAVRDAHFNLKERRNAASVHLMYPVAEEIRPDAFYCEVTAIEDPVHTFYMACGWHRGYFGMQINGPSERRVIFSVWDSGSEAVDRSKVEVGNRVQLVSKGEGVYSGDFGNEGTGGHSHLKSMWKTGTPQRFVVTAMPVDAAHTIFSGYWFHPDNQKWMLISAWNAPQEGGLLRGLHSFSENFGGANGNLRRRALFGNQWIHEPEGQWTELTTARFSHDPTGKADRLDRFMGVEDSEFFLSHGGFVEGSTEYGARFVRPSTGHPPDDFEMPKLRQ